MTTSTTLNKGRTSGNGVTTSFPYSIKIKNESDIVVQTIDSATDAVVNTLVLNDGGSLGYTVSFDTDAETLTIVTVTAPITGEDLFVLRNLPLTQETDFPTASKFPASSVEDALDKNVMLMQDLQEEVDRSLKFSETSEIAGVEFPEPTANTIIGWNSAGDNLENKTDIANIPVPTTGDAGKVLIVNSGETLYELETKYIKSDTTITVAPSGATYTTIDEALSAIATWVISKDATLTIDVAEGTYTRTAGTVLNHPYGSRILIEGAEPEDLTVSSLVSITSNGTQDHDVVFQFSSIGSSSVGDTINIRDLTGTGHYKVLEGCWEITAINGASNQLTVKNTAKDTSISASTVTDGTFKRFKTVLEYNDSVGLVARSRFIEGSSELTGLKNMCLVGNGAATYSGVFVDYFAYVGLIREFGIRGFGRHNVYVIYKGGVSMLGVCSSSAASSGVQALAGSQVQAVSSVSTGNGAYGYVATSTANMACSTANGSGNTTGFAALIDSQITSNSGFAVANTSYGSQSDTDSLVRAESHNYLDNGTDVFSQFNSTHKLSGATLVTASPELNHFGNKGALNTDESTATDAVSYEGLRTFDDGIAVTGNIDVDGTVLSDDSLAFSQSEVRDFVGNIELETLSVNRDIKIFGASTHVMTLNLGNSGGNNGYIEFISTGTGLHHGTGSPEGSVTAPIGSQYMRSDGGVGTSFYVKESGTGNTGWVAK